MSRSEEEPFAVYMELSNVDVVGNSARSVPAAHHRRGKTLSRRPIYDDRRVAVIERFWFESRENGTMLIDSRLSKNWL